MQCPDCQKLRHEGECEDIPTVDPAKITVALDMIQEHVNMAVRNLAQILTTGSNGQFLSIAERELDHISSEVTRIRRHFHLI